MTRQRVDVRIERAKRRLRGTTTLVCAVEEGGAEAFDGVRVHAEGLKIDVARANGTRERDAMERRVNDSAW